MGATVLLVEDERKLRELVRSYLERAGFTALSTESGAEAITLAATTAPDLVVLDLGLPDLPRAPVGRAGRRPAPRRAQAVQPARTRAARPGHPAPRPAVGHAAGRQLRWRRPAHRRG